jgi:uncharacterized protein (TIGR02611 family)
VTSGWTAAPPHAPAVAPHPHEDHWFRRAARRVPKPVRLLVGSFLVLAGIAMLVLPGPGLLTIFVGLQVLALDIPVAARAERAVLHRVRAAAEKAKAKRASRRGGPAPH